MGGQSCQNSGRTVRRELDVEAGVWRPPGAARKVVCGGRLFVFCWCLFSSFQQKSSRAE